MPGARSQSEAIPASWGYLLAEPQTQPFCMWLAKCLAMVATFLHRPGRGKHESLDTGEEAVAVFLLAKGADAQGELLRFFGACVASKGPADSGAERRQRQHVWTV